MTAIVKWLRVNSIRGADLNCTGAWAFVVECLNMSDTGFNHKKESAIRLDEKAREALGFPPLLELTNTMLQLRLSAHSVGKESEDQEWNSALWADWRKRKATNGKPYAVYLVGLERHEYVEYGEEVNYGGKKLHEVVRLSEEEQIRTTRFCIGVERKGVSVAKFYSEPPSGYRGPSMGYHEEPVYPQFYFALAVTSEEYTTLSNFLGQAVAFDIEVTQPKKSE